MKYTRFQKIFLALVIVFNLIGIILSIYDYFNDQIFETLEIWIYLFLIMAIILIVSIVILFFRYNWKYKVLILSIIICSFILSTYIGYIFYFTSLRKFELPKIISSKEIMSTEFRCFSSDSNYFLVNIYRNSKMAFGSGHHYLGLYSKNNEIVDECCYGEIGLSVQKWIKDTIYINATHLGSDTLSNKLYLFQWLDKNKYIYKFKLEYIPKYKHN